MDYRLRPCAPTFTLAADGKAIATVERIGRGTFCTAYRPVEIERTDDRVYLVVSEDDPSKEILADCSSSHIPQLTRLGVCGDRGVWQTRFYGRLTAKAKPAWQHFKILKEAADRLRVSFIRRDGYATYSWGYDYMQAIVDDVTGKVPESLSEALRALADSAANYGSEYSFEFAPRNLATDSEGRLILLDPVFNMETIANRDKAAHAARVNRNRQRGW